jgi:hypothetical protein
MANQYKPRHVYRQEFPAGEAHSMDADAFDDALRSQGAQFIHWRSMGCPQGMVNKDDTTRHTHADHSGCSNGYLYKCMGPITGLFTGNSSETQFQDPGAVDGSTVQVTFARDYDNKPGKMAYFSYADRFYLAEDSILYPHWEIMEYSVQGVDKLRFPATEVEHLIDSQMREYHQGVDFMLRDGNIVWVPGRGPGMDPDADGQRGRVCSVWYLYRPYWYLERLGKTARIIQTEDADGVRRATRMPVQATLVRETTFEDRERDDQPGRVNPRDQRQPPDGSFE